MESLSLQLQPFVAWLLRSTLQASMLIGLILLVQIALRSRLSPRWSHALWLILLVRMVLPWAPQSRVSIFNLIPHSDSPVVWGLPHHLPNGGLKPTLHTSVLTTNTLERVSQPTPHQLSGGQDPHFLSVGRRLARLIGAGLPLIWLAGVLVLGIYICVSSFSLLRIVRRERPLTDQKILDLVEDCKAETGIRTVLGVVATDKVRSACLFGFIRPRLLLPKGMVEALNSQELRYVFLHELGHLKRHDIWLGWLTSILQALHWFNPLVWLAFYRMRADRELACDAFVLARTQIDESRNYGRTIVSLLERFSRPQVLPALAGILETKSQLKRRIKMIARSKKTSPVQWAAAVLIFAVLVGIGLTDAYPAPPPFEFGTPTNLGPLINSSIQDWPLWLTADGLSLWFFRTSTSYGETGETFVATRATKEDAWGSPVSLGVGGDTHFLWKTMGVVPGITTADGLETYFPDTRAGGYGSSDLWMMKRETIGADWSQPVNLGPVVNTSAGELAPTISPDGLELYFNSSATAPRPGGYGSSDLWVTWRATRNGPWGTPVNLGPTVNTAYREHFPVLLGDGLLLFFYSTRPGGYGGADLYVMSRASLSDPWGPPVNLGPLVNSAGDEYFVYISADGSNLYFDSTRPGGHGGFDIWQAPILAAPTCGDSEHPYPAVDLNKDCRVDLADLALLLAHWLECTAPECTEF